MDKNLEAKKFVQKIKNDASNGEKIKLTKIKFDSINKLINDEKNENIERIERFEKFDDFQNFTPNMGDYKDILNAEKSKLIKVNENNSQTPDIKKHLTFNKILLENQSLNDKDYNQMKKMLFPKFNNINVLQSQNINPVDKLRINENMNLPQIPEALNRKSTRLILSPIKRSIPQTPIKNEEVIDNPKQLYDF